jgi:hypothetical protein
MPAQDQLPWSDSNQYSEDSACVHCEGVLLHESWCPAENANAHYAYRAVAQPNLLSLGDQLILHALGVAWTTKTTQPKLRASRTKVSQQASTS